VDLSQLFSSEVPVVESVVRGAVMYLVLLIMMRVDQARVCADHHGDHSALQPGG